MKNGDCCRFCGINLSALKALLNVWLKILFFKSAFKKLLEVHEFDYGKFHSEMAKVISKCLKKLD